jgi:hypothetical protein
MNINRIKNDRGSSVEQKYALNSKLFEQFINQYEQKIKKALFDIGINPDAKYNETKRDYFRNEYDGNFNNLPFLNSNNNNEQRNNLNGTKMKKNKIISSYNLNVDNLNYLELKTSTNENSNNNNNNNNNNNLTNSINSNNGNNNIIFQNSYKNNYTNNIDNYSCNTNVNTKSHTINSINSAKGKEAKKLISGESTGIENNNNLITIDKINLEKKEKIKKQRAMSTNPYTVKTTIDGNNKDNNNNLELKNYHYYNSCNTSLYFPTKIIENDLSNYEIGHTLGKGAYAVVKICTNKITKERFAVKIYEKSKLNDNSKKNVCIEKLKY